jgi:hypothetical protein
MHDEVQVYDHPLLTDHARRLLVVLGTVAVLVLGSMTPAHAAGGGHIVGTVTAVGGGPIEGVLVEVFDPDDFDPFAYDVTDASGHYDVTIAPGTYDVIFESGNGEYESELYDDVHDFDLDRATPVVVPSTGSATADASLTRLASISGHVTQSAGDDDDLVRAYDDRGRVVAAGLVGTDGSYKIRGLTPGSYRLAFNRLSGFAFSAAEFYDDHQEGEGLASGDQVTLSDGEARTGVDAVLVEGGHITGTLHDSDGHPMRCRLQAFTDGSVLVTRNGWSNATTGAFDITGLSTGGYLVRVINGADCQNGVQYLHGTGGALSTDKSSAEPVATTRGGRNALASSVVYDLGPAPTNTDPPTILGQPVVGATLTARHGGWSPGSHLTYSYQWLSDGALVGTAQTYKVSSFDVGRAISVRITAHRGARSGVATSASTAPVSAPGLHNLSAPSVTARPEVAVNALLTAQPGLWSPPEGTTYIYVWSSGARVWQSGADPGFRVPEQAYAQPLNLTVVAHRTGFADASAGVLVTGKVALGDWFSGIRAPRLLGSPRVGALLRVRATKIEPKPQKVTFTWYRDGRKIKGVKGKRYTLTRADVGHRIHVLVGYHRANYRVHYGWTRLLGPVRD